MVFDDLAFGYGHSHDLVHVDILEHIPVFALGSLLFSWDSIVGYLVVVTLGENFKLIQSSAPVLFDICLLSLCEVFKQLHHRLRLSALSQPLDMIFDGHSSAFLVAIKVGNDLDFLVVQFFVELSHGGALLETAFVPADIPEIMVLRRRVVSIFEDQLLCIGGDECMRLHFLHEVGRALGQF